MDQVPFCQIAIQKILKNITKKLLGYSWRISAEYPAEVFYSLMLIPTPNSGVTI